MDILNMRAPDARERQRSAADLVQWHRAACFHTRAAICEAQHHALAPADVDAMRAALMVAASALEIAHKAQEATGAEFAPGGSVVTLAGEIAWALEDARRILRRLGGAYYAR